MVLIISHQMIVMDIFEKYQDMFRELYEIQWGAKLYDTLKL